MKLRQEKRIMAALEDELQGFSKTLSPDWLQWAITQDIGYGPWKIVARMAKTILYFMEKQNA